MADLNWGGLAGILGGSGLLYNAYQNLGGIGDTIREQMFSPGGYVDQAQQKTQFTPFGVSATPYGAMQFDQSGGYQMNLTPDQLAQQQQLAQGAQQFYGNAMMPTGQREQDIYGRIRAMQTPEEQRQMLGLEGRLQAQGRSGIQSNMYGGTPEQLAMAKAQAEAQNQASLMAMQQAQAEQMQQGQLGQMYQQGQYLPLNAMMTAANPALQAAQLRNAAQQYGAGLWGQMVTGGLEGQLGARLGQANLAGQLGSGLLSGLFTTAANGMNTGVDSIGGLLGAVTGGIGSLFGSGGSGGNTITNGTWTGTTNAGLLEGI